jgi:hypothetical protein
MRFRSMRRGVLVALLAVALTGCLAEGPDPVAPSGPPPRPTPSASPSPRASVVAVSSDRASPGASVVEQATPAPSLPDDPSRIAVVERDGVRLTLELDRNPMPAGEPTWVTTTIQNTGRDAITYYPCGEAVTVGGEIDGVPWRSGVDLPVPAATWKSYLTAGQGLRGGGRTVLFFPDGLDGAASGCGDIGISATLAAGAEHRERLRWDGFTFRRLGPPPTASLDLIGSFAFDRGVALEPPPEARRRAEVRLPAWIAGPLGPLLDPAEAVDLALADPRLTDLLGSRNLHSGNEGVLLFDGSSGIYQIGMLESGGLPISRVHLVLVDARSGRIAGFVDRDWDYQVDGYP